MTVWKKIPGLPERYEASDSGLIRTLSYETPQRRNGITLAKPKRIEGRILLPFLNKRGHSNGHPVVSVNQIGSKKGEMRVALLVCRAFHGCPYTPGDRKGCQQWRVRHKDGDVLNNYAENLEWIATTNGGRPVEDLYQENLRKLKERKEESTSDWLKRMFGEDYAEDEELVSA